MKYLLITLLMNSYLYSNEKIIFVNGFNQKRYSNDIVKVLSDEYKENFIYIEIKESLEETSKTLFRVLKYYEKENIKVKVIGYSLGGLLVSNLGGIVSNSELILINPLLDYKELIKRKKSFKVSDEYINYSKKNFYFTKESNNKTTFILSKNEELLNYDIVYKRFKKSDIILINETHIIKDFKKYLKYIKG